jgi:hypothetical protein
VPDGEYFNGKMDRIFTDVLQEEREEFESTWDQLGY